MENNIDLFDRYVDNKLSAEEKLTFESRLKSDSDFSLEFKTYLRVVRGICQEARQENYEFGHAVKSLSRAELFRIIGKTETASQPRVMPIEYLRRRMGWISSIAAILVIAFATNYFILRSASHTVDNTIVAYNYIAPQNRGDVMYRTTRDTRFDFSREDRLVIKEELPYLERQYRDAAPDDVQAQQDAGMRLAMAYLALHERKQSCKILNELRQRFADDEIFVAKCDKILGQIE